MPKQTLDLPLPMIQLGADNSLPLHRQLYNQLRAAICNGDLKLGTRLPSTRTLAKELGVSRTTTIEAYRDLLAEGYLEAQVGAGTRVVQHLPDLSPYAKTAAKAGERTIPIPINHAGTESALRLSSFGQRLASMVKPSWFFTSSPLRPFRLGVPALDAIPQKAWSRLITRVVRQPEPAQLDYQRAAGYLPLREQVAAYLAVARGVRCQPEQVIITTGIQSGLALICNVLLDAGDAVWMEDPGYFLAQSLFQAFGIQMVPVPLDREGLCVAVGQQQAPNARLAYVTPSHQFPLGMTMSQARRCELLQWAQQTGGWIVEDDYDSEYRYVGRTDSHLARAG